MTSIYNPKTSFLVLDIETCKKSNNIIFDIAFSVYNRKEGIKGIAGYLVEENRDQIPYYADRLKRYDEYLSQEKYSYKPFITIMAIMKGIIRKYSVKFGVAYNSGFDFGKIELACKMAGIENPLQNLVEIDLYHTTCQTLGKQKFYKNFVEQNNLVTPKGNRKTNAETFYGYMIQNPDFQEEHTGYGDVLIEIEILDRVLRQKKKMKLERNRESWKIAQE